MPATAVSASASVPTPNATLAVIGGGPKAVALAAMASAVAQAGGPLIRVDVYDPRGIGANWGGMNGYTDGEQRLCTFAERDLGFPYSYEFLRTGRPHNMVAKWLTQEFSWHSFLVAGGGSRFERWVNDGRRRPIHAQFRDYLQWAFTKIPNHVASLVEEQVVEVRRYNNVHWEVSSSDGTTTRQRNPYDGVVLTGPGPARKLAVKGPPDKLRVFDGQDFWSRKPDVKRQLDAMLAPGRTLADSERIVIVGAGGTAAAILGWLVENGARTLPIEVIAGSQAALHMRSENPFENRLFTDSTAWMKLKPETRRAFTGRLNRGVVWEAVLDRISHLRSISILEGTAEQYEVLADGTLGVDYKTFDDSVPLPTIGASPVTLTTTAASLVVDASGFDDMKWLDLFTMNPNDRQAYRKQLEDDLDDRLQLRGSPWNSRPPVHAPMLSSLVGPGYASLMSLGGMAERVLSRYGA